MDTTACYACRTILTDRALFCPECSRQVRCRACRALLEPNAKGCVECGVRMGQGDAVGTATVDGGTVERRPQNRLRFEESRSSRSLEIDFTDKAVDSFSDSLGNFIISGLATAATRGRRSSHPEINEVEEDVLEAVAMASPATTTPPMLQAPTDQSEADLLRGVFRREGDQLRLFETRLKGKSKLDSARRLVYLRLLYGASVEMQDKIERDELINIINENNWLDNSTASRILHNNNDLTGDSKLVGLNASGLEIARGMLGQVVDDTVKQVWKLGDTARKSGSKTGKSDGKKAENSSNAEKSKSDRLSVDGWGDEWRKLGITISENAKIRNGTTLDKAIFGLWAIRSATKDRVKGATSYYLTEFLWKTFEIKIDRRYIDRNLGSSDDTKDKIEKVGTKFHLKLQAMEYAKSLADSQ